MKKKTVLIITGLVLLIIIIGASVNASKQSSDEKVYTLKQFERLHEGVTYENVTYRLGSDGELVSEDHFDGYKITVYSWTNPDGGNMMLTFTNDSLDSKVQVGLK